MASWLGVSFQSFSCPLGVTTLRASFSGARADFAKAIASSFVTLSTAEKMSGRAYPANRHSTSDTQVFSNESSERSSAP